MSRQTRVAGDIGDRLAELRGVLGWSQERLGQEVGRDRSAVNAWENGRRLPDTGVFYALASKYGWPLEMFMEGGPRPGTVVSRPGRPVDVRPAAVTLDRVNEAMMVALGSFSRYAVKDEPIPWREAMQVLADLSEMLGLIEGAATPKGNGAAKG